MKALPYHTWIYLQVVNSQVSNSLGRKKQTLISFAHLIGAVLLESELCWVCCSPDFLGTVLQLLLLSFLLALIGCVVFPFAPSPLINGASTHVKLSK